MKIYLVGFMGAGKTTVGRELASRIEVPFFDLDELIASAEKLSIKELFEQKGEPYFRKREHELLRSTRPLDTSGPVTWRSMISRSGANTVFVRGEQVAAKLAYVKG